MRRNQRRKKRQSTRLILVVLGSVLIVMGWPIHSAEYLASESVAPKSALTTNDAISAEYRDKEKEKKLSDRLRTREQGLLRDAVIVFRPRLFDFARDDFSGLERGLTAGGINLDYRSGRWRDSLSLNLSYASSFEVNDRYDNGSLGLLKTGGGSVSVLSEANLRIDSSESGLGATLFRQSFNLPYLNRQDSRMIPNTFDAVRIDYTTESSDLIFGYVNKIKKRDSDRFISMSRAAGDEKGSQGVIMAGARFAGASWEIGGLNLYNRDALNIFYLESRYRNTGSAGIDYQIATQYTRQRSVGSEDVGTIDTRLAGLKLVASWRHILLSLKYTQTGKNGDIQSPWGGRPHFNSMMIGHFDRAGERARGVGISYALDRWRLPAFSLSVKYSRGRNAQDSVGQHLPDRKESDLTIDYKPVGAMQGLWVRFRFARMKLGGENLRDVRFILNYPVQLL
jgi:hypothetical protein